MSGNDADRPNDVKAERDRDLARKAKRSRPRRQPDDPPAAGPHAAPDLSNPEATPGAGALQAPGAEEDMDSTG